jgi:hypothetical protein
MYIHAYTGGEGEDGGGAMRTCFRNSDENGTCDHHTGHTSELKSSFKILKNAQGLARFFAIALAAMSLSQLQ